MKTFLEYLSDDELIDFVIKERIKSASKGVLKPKAKRKPSVLQKEVQSMMPPRSTWKRPGRVTRAKCDKVEQHYKIAIKNKVKNDLKCYRDNYGTIPANCKYLPKLLKFIAEVQDMARGNLPMDFASCIEIVAQFKKMDGKTGDAIYRPLSVYNSLEVKALISIAAKYLVEHLDETLHEEILSYRPSRIYHSEAKTITCGDHAVRGLKEFMARHKRKRIYVAECDIQKFYDVLNHDVALECFAKKAERAGIPEYHQVERVLKAYLDSYSFYSHVMKLNDSEEFWKQYRATRMNINGRHRFEWVSDEALLDCYGDEGMLSVCKDKLGVPQGGALSSIVSNVVMDMVDREILGNPVTDDPDRFFVRYGDDILLAHTDMTRCRELIDGYVSALRKYHLPYHPFKPLEEFKRSEKTLKGFWDVKSKEPFLWGPGEGNAFEWIGFVGYEIRYDGQTRMRLSTLDKKFAAINKAYHACIFKGEPKNPERYIASVRKKMGRISGSMDQFPELKSVAYDECLVHQMKHLDRYRNHKIKKLHAKLLRKYPELNLQSMRHISLHDLLGRDTGVAYSFYKKLEDRN